MSATETQTPPPEVERITVVLRAKEGSTLNQVNQFAGTGLIVAIGRGLGVLEAHCQGDAIQIAHQATMRLGEAIESHGYEIDLHKAALSTPAHLAAHAQEMFDLLVRINTKCGGLDATLGHGIEPSEQMWTESREAMEAIWELQDKIQSAAAVDKVCVNQLSETSESVNQTVDSVKQNNDSVNQTTDSVNQTADIPAVTDSPYADIRVKNIDLWIKTLENAKRYEWLRDNCGAVEYKAIAGSIGPGMLPSGENLDSRVDEQMKAQASRQQATPSSEASRASQASSTVENAPLQATPNPRDERFQL